MKRFGLRMMLFAVLSVGCSKNSDAPVVGNLLEEGNLTVNVVCENSVTKSVAYGLASVDAAVSKVDVMVFDAGSKRLERYATKTSVSDACTFSVPAGEKLVYAILNGPDVSQVRCVADLLGLVDCLEESSLETDGLAMVGSAACAVVPGQVSRPEIVVGRMVSRIVLHSLACDVAEQYGGLKIGCVFLGNAYVSQKISGECLDVVNVDGYADSDKKFPIGKNGVTGACPEYLYRTIGCDVSVGDAFAEDIYMYCQPNDSEEFTCLYILVTIGDLQYYYRVPLDRKLKSNVTYSVDAVITNLGSELPPDGDLHKGDIAAVVTVSDWASGGDYVARF